MFIAVLLKKVGPKQGRKVRQTYREDSFVMTLGRVYSPAIRVNAIAPTEEGGAGAIRESAQFDDRGGRVLPPYEMLGLRDWVYAVRR
jgi:hypothetical protein